MDGLFQPARYAAEVGAASVDPATTRTGAELFLGAGDEWLEACPGLLGGDGARGSLQHQAAAEQVSGLGLNAERIEPLPHLFLERSERISRGLLAGRRSCRWSRVRMTRPSATTRATSTVPSSDGA